MSSFAPDPPNIFLPINPMLCFVYASIDIREFLVLDMKYENRYCYAGVWCLPLCLCLYCLPWSHVNNNPWLFCNSASPKSIWRSTKKLENMLLLFCHVQIDFWTEKVWPVFIWLPFNASDRKNGSRNCNIDKLENNLECNCTLLLLKCLKT